MLRGRVVFRAESAGRTLLFLSDGYAPAQFLWRLVPQVADL